MMFHIQGLINQQRVINTTRLRIQLLGAALLVVVAGVCKGQEPAAAEISLVENNISLIANVGTGLDYDFVGQLIITGSNLPQPSATESANELCDKKGGTNSQSGTPHLQEVCDISGGLDSVEVSYESEYIGKKGNEYRWSVTANVSGISPAGSFNRYATVMIDGGRYWLNMRYSVSALTASTLTVNQPPKRWVIGTKNDQISLQVHSKGARVDQFSIVNSSLQANDTNKRLNVNAFDVCKDAATTCSSDKSLPGDKTTTVYLKADATKMPYGQYGGTLTFAADGVTLSKPIELTIFSSGAKIKWSGLGLIALGVIFGLIITVVAPHKAQRIETLRPAVEIRSSTVIWLKRLANSETMTSETFSLSNGSLSDIGTALTDKALEDKGYVPGEWPIALKVTKKPLQTYDTYLKNQNDALYVAAAIVASGFEPIASQWSNYSSNPAHKKITVVALAALDELSRSAVRTTVKSSIATILGKLDADIAVANGRIAAPVSDVRAQATLDSLTAELRILNRGSWLIWLVITIAGGWAALILTNDGFGTLRDLFTCFGWGLGLQVVGPQLQQLTPAKIATQIKIDIPK